MQRYKLTYRLNDDKRPSKIEWKGKTFELDQEQIFDNWEEVRGQILGLMGSEDDRPIQSLKLEPYPKAKTVSKHTRAGRFGKNIICPVCKVSTKVYHFAWDAAVCQGCGQDILKKDYILEN